MKKRRSSEDQFNQAFRKAFEDAELNPSPLVWSELEKKIPSNKTWKYVFWALIPSLFIGILGLIWFLGVDSEPSIALQKEGMKQARLLEDPSSSQGEEPSWKLSSPLASGDSSSQIRLENSKTPQRKTEQVKIQDKPMQAKNPRVNHSKASQKTQNNPPILKRENLNPENSQEKQELFLGQKPLLEKQEQKGKKDLRNLYSMQVIPLLEFKKSRVQAVIENIAVKEPRPVQEVDNSPFRLSFSIQPQLLSPQMQGNYVNYLNDYAEAHQLNSINTEAFFEGLEERASQRNSFGLELAFEYQWSPHWQIQSGISYSRLFFQQNSNALFTTENGETYSFLAKISENALENPNLAMSILNSPNYSSGNAQSLRLEDINPGGSQALENRLEYIRIPLRLLYTFNPGARVEQSLGLGTSANIFLGARLGQDSGPNTLGKNSIYRPISWSLRANWRFLYRLDSHWGIQLEPFYEKSLRQTQSRDYLQFRPHTWGLSLGMQYRF